ALTAGKLGAEVPAFLIVVVESEQIVDRGDGLALARFAVSRTRGLPLLLHSREDEHLFAVARPSFQFVGLEQGRGGIVAADGFQRGVQSPTDQERRGIVALHVAAVPRLKRPAHPPPCHRTLGIVLERRLERARRLHPYVGVVVAESLIEKRLT